MVGGEDEIEIETKTGNNGHGNNGDGWRGAYAALAAAYAEAFAPDAHVPVGWENRVMDLLADQPGRRGQFEAITAGQMRAACEYGRTKRLVAFTPATICLFLDEQSRARRRPPLPADPGPAAAAGPPPLTPAQEESARRAREFAERRAWFQELPESARQDFLEAAATARIPGPRRPDCLEALAVQLAWRDRRDRRESPPVAAAGGSR